MNEDKEKQKIWKVKLKANIDLIKMLPPKYSIYHFVTYCFTIHIWYFAAVFLKTFANVDVEGCITHAYNKWCTHPNHNSTLPLC
jgi:hypothetical protein